MNDASYQAASLGRVEGIFCVPFAHNRDSSAATGGTSRRNSKVGE
jgi:hypothetical protein